MVECSHPFRNVCIWRIRDPYTGDLLNLPECHHMRTASMIQRARVIASKITAIYLEDVGGV